MSFTDSMGQTRPSLFIDDSRFNSEKYEHCWDFKECEDLDDYIQSYLNHGSSDVDIDESSYQYIYDETNDWFREDFTPTDLQNAFIVGAMWMRQRMLIEKYSKNNK